MSDLISRKAVLEEIQKIECEPGYQHVGEDWVVGLIIAENIVESAESIESTPSAEPKRRWIPVTEALPEEEKDVLVSVHFEGFKGKTVDLPPSDYVEIASHIEGVWSSPSDEYKVVEVNHHVIAWMPLPEPLRGNE